MVFTDYLNSAYSMVGQAANLTMKMGHNVLSSVGIIQKSAPEVKLPPSLQNLDVSKLVHHGGVVVRIAAISGAAAVIIGAYGAHTLFGKELAEKEDFKEREALYERANKYHYYHTLALLAAPLTRYPRIVACFMVGGIILFSGTCYYHAFTGDKTLKKLTPVGGVFLILAWLSMLL